MISQEMITTGTLKPDGTLELDGKPDLPPGRVQVVLRQEVAASPSSESMLEFLHRTRRELEAAGSHFMNDQEVEDHIAWLREEDPIDVMLRDLDAS